MPGTENASDLFWRYDSLRIAYFDNEEEKLFKIGINDGSPEILTRYPEGFHLANTGIGGGAWTPEGIVFVGGGWDDSRDLWQISENSENLSILIEPLEGEGEFQDPSPLPDGQGL